MVDVYIGTRNEESFEVVSGLKEGDLVIASPTTSTKIGQIIHIEGDDDVAAVEVESTPEARALAGSCTKSSPEGSAS